MKLSITILLSAIFVLILPVASLAAEPLPTTIFLKDSLSTLAPGNADVKTGFSKKQKSHQLTSLEPKMDTASLQQQKLPTQFIPRRYLPTEAELQAQKESHQREYQRMVKQPYVKLSAKIDPSLLSGQILLEEQQSTSSNSSKSIGSSNYDKEPLSNLGFVLAKKVAAGVRQLVNPSHHAKSDYFSYPKDLTAILKKEGHFLNAPLTSYLVRSTSPDASFNCRGDAMHRPWAGPCPAPTSFQTNRSGTTALKDYSNLQKAPTLDLAKMPNFVEPPILSRRAQDQLADLVNSNLPQGDSGLNNSSKMHDYAADSFTINNQQSGQPLNLIAGQLQAMKTGRRSHKVISGRPASFGAWHNNGQLPKTCFSSYIQSKSTGLHSFKASTGSRHTGKQSPFAKTYVARGRHLPASAIAMRKTSKKQEPFVASYLPYKRYSI